jgi:RNA polymerase I-specific transcription initiation factor RRN6
VKAIPEVGPAIGMLALLNRESKRPALHSHRSTLLTVGFATDMDHLSGNRNLQILALPSGGAGNVLRLIKPRVEGLGWEGHNGIKLRVLNPVSSEECFWHGEGGPIEQATFGIDNNRHTSWLAVRRAESTAILRPTFHRVPVTTTVQQDLGATYAPSRLRPNHLLTLKTDQTGGRPHVDVSFNPWYVRQFAIVDEQGHWSIWNIEGQNRKRKTIKAIPGRSGQVHSDSLDLGSNVTSVADGWCRVLWAGSVSTLLGFERRSFSIFDLKGPPKRLSCPAVINPRSTDWILDVKRSANRLDEIFILTTTEIYWMQIYPLGEDSVDTIDHNGAKILLSCRHFRDGEDNSLKIEVLLEDDGMIRRLLSLFQANTS